MISKRTAHYTEKLLAGLGRGWSVGKICALGKAGLIDDGDVPDPNFPEPRCVWDWLRVDPQFFDLYLAARRAGCEAMVDTGLMIVDNAHHDVQWHVDEETGELHKVVDHEHVHRSRLRADYRKWYVAKLVPRLYGERVEVEHKGSVDVVATRLAEGRQRALGHGAVLDGTFTRVVEPELVKLDDGSDLV